MRGLYSCANRSGVICYSFRLFVNLRLQREEEGSALKSCLGVGHNGMRLTVELVKWVLLWTIVKTFSKATQNLFDFMGLSAFSKTNSYLK